MALESTREIYWNIPSSSIPLMYLLSAVATGVMLWGFYRRIRVYQQGETWPPLSGLGARVFRGLKLALTQKKVRRQRGIGQAHNLFFWGFGVLFLGTVLVFIQADITDPLFGVRFLTGRFYQLYSVTLDVAGLVALVMIVGMFVRRFFVPSMRGGIKPADLWMYMDLGLILGTGYLIEGLRMAVTELTQNPELANYSPVGLGVARLVAPLGEASIRSWHFGIWWFHMLLVMAFLAMIPFTRLKHLLLTPLNYILFEDQPKGYLKTLDLEDESAESFGVATPKDLSFKDIFDTDACTSCSRCQDRCPAYNTDKPLSPMKLIEDMGKVCFAMENGSLIDGVGKDALFSCTTCGACMEICPAEIKHVPKIIDMRRNLALMEGEFTGEEVAKAMDAMEVNGNPLGFAPAKRADWAEGLDLVPVEEADYLYFTGCYGSFDSRNQQVAKSLVKLAAAAGVKLAILGPQEKCCGEPARKMGNEYLYQSLAMENIELFKEKKVKKIVTSCPHCFQTLNKDYRDLGLEAEVVHYTELLAKLWKDLRFQLGKTSLEVTYHDSCYLGRYNGIFDAPRDLLAAAGAKLSEMSACKEESFCCGAGGGRILAEENLGTRINNKRATMAQQTGAEAVVSSCPFCLTMMEDGTKNLTGEPVKAMDLAELLVSCLPTESTLEDK